ncbi:hypothetical protein OC844_001749 [Tilletia horrida]|nr:hypothetical protein OC844_001749 [Tilletia horrida]
MPPVGQDATPAEPSAPLLPPRPGTSIGGGGSNSNGDAPGSTKPTPFATRKLVAPPLASSNPAAAAAAAVGGVSASASAVATGPAAASSSKAFEPPPRRPGAPVPGSLSIARSLGSNFQNLAAPAPSPGSLSGSAGGPTPSAPMSIARSGPFAGSAAPSLTPFPSTSFGASSSSFSLPPGSSLPPPPVRRLPGLASSTTPIHSPVLTPISLDNHQIELSSSPANQNQADSIPKLPPRRHPSQPRPQHSSLIVGQKPERHPFLPSNSTLPPVGISASTATATLLPPPVRTTRASPSGSVTSRLVAPSSAAGGVVQRSAGFGPNGNTPPRLTAAIVEPAARARYEALFDRELAAQLSRRRRRAKTIPSGALPETSLGHSFGFSADKANPSIARLRPVAPSTGGNGSTVTTKPTGSRHRFGTSDPSFSMLRGNGSDHSSASSSTPSPANVNALKGFFENKACDTAAPPSHSASSNSGVRSAAVGSAAAEAGSQQPPPPPPERKMAKSNTEHGLHLDLEALRLKPPPALAIRSPGNRVRAVSASAPGYASADEATSPSAFDDRGCGRAASGYLGGGSGGASQHERERSGASLAGSLRSLSSKDLRADATAAASASATSAPYANLAASTTASSSSYGNSASNLKFSGQSAGQGPEAQRLSPRRTRKLWRRSRLREAFLAKLWDVMGGDADGISREAFVRGMAAIDFELAKRAQAGGRGPGGPGAGPALGNGAGVGASRGRPAERAW